MVQPQVLERTLSRCYDALFDDKLWPTVLDQLASAFGAQGCSFVSQGGTATRLRLPASSAYQQFLVDFIGEGWAQSDHRARRGWPRLSGGGVVLTEHDISTDEERERMPVYRDLYARHDLVWWGTVSFIVEDDLWAMSFLRSGAAEPFQRSDVPGLRSLAPHLARLITLKSRFQQTKAYDAVGFLESADVAACVVDENLRVVAINSTAETILGPEIGIFDGRICATDRLIDRKLHELVRGTKSNAHERVPSPLAVERLGRRPLLVDAVSSPRLVARYFETHTVLLLTDLDRSTASEVGRMQTIFGLTRAEADLAVHLAAGTSLATAADELGIAKETGRSQLKAVFQKTGVNRQAELACLLQRSSRRSTR